MSTMRSSTLALAAAFVLLWNSGFIGAEVAIRDSDPFSLLFWRYLALTLVLALVVPLSGRSLWPGRGPAARSALVGALAHGVWLTGVLVAQENGVDPGIVALVIALQPLSIGAFSGLVVGETTSARQWLGLLLGLIGVVLVIGVRMNSGSGSPLAHLAPFLSVAAITVASLLQRRWEVRGVNRELPMSVQLFWQVAATCALMVLPAWLLEGFAVRWTTAFSLSFVWLVLAVSLLAYGLLWKLHERMAATKVAALYYLGPPVTMLMAWIGFGDTIGWMDLAGMAIASVGVLLVLSRRRASTA